MRTSLPITVLTLILCAMLAVTAVALLARPSEESQADAKASNEQLNAQGEQPTGYYLRDYDGRLAVFRAGSDTPYALFDCYTHQLPSYDQSALKAGVYAESYEQLVALIEDYIS